MIGLNPELKSYRILANDRRIVNSKDVDFLDYSQDHQNPSNDNSDELVVEQRMVEFKDETKKADDYEKEEETVVKIEEEDSDSREASVEGIQFQLAYESSDSDNEEIEEILVAEPAPLGGRIL